MRCATAGSRGSISTTPWKRLSRQRDRGPTARPLGAALRGPARGIAASQARRRLGGVTTIDLGRVAGEASTGSHFARWALFRRSALGLYLAALVAWSGHYGIPVQRELVI